MCATAPTHNGGPGAVAGARRAPLRARQDAAFTLTELLVALTILAVISAVAIPIYSRYSMRTYRVEAQADLLDCAQAVERFASESFSYLSSADTNGDGSGDADTGPVAETICAPRSQTEGRYAFSIAAETNGFLLSAVPVDAAGNVMRDDGFMTIDDAGNRAWDRNDDGSIGSGEDTWEP